MPFGGGKMPTPRGWVRMCELEKAAIEPQSVEKWIEIDRKLDPNWTEEKSKALYQRKEEWLKGCTERLNEARANLSAAEDRDIWSLLETGEGITSRATSFNAG
jgi:hypothetical protein